MSGRVAETVAARLEHTLLPPHEEDGFTSRTAAYAIGVAFTGQDAAVTSHPGGRPRTVGFGPGTVGVNGARPLTWHRTTGRPRPGHTGARSRPGCCGQPAARS